MVVKHNSRAILVKIKKKTAFAIDRQGDRGLQSNWNNEDAAK